ncbi:MAG: Spy/CpxP family protein refolding chaperone [Acidobacteriota bacterium]|nr:Spy/CpxP family protein refolding chaperone [Acidobacteriota bacterium]
MKRNLIPKAVFAALVFFFALAFNSSGQARTDKTKTEKRPLEAFARNELNLTPEQETRLEELRKARREDNMAFRDKMVKARTAFREGVNDPKADGGKVDALIDEMAKLRAEHMKSGLRHRREVEKVFTPEQMEKLKALRGAGRERGFMRGGRFMEGGRSFGHQGFRPHRVPRRCPMDPGYFPRQRLDRLLR